VIRIVEDKDASDEERSISEINTGILAVKAALLGDCLSAIKNDNAQGEYYLTDIIAMAVDKGVSIVTESPGNIAEVMGVNVWLYRILSFGVSSFLVGISGALWGHYVRVVSDEHFGIWLSVQYLAMIIIGGTGPLDASHRRPWIDWIHTAQVQAQIVRDYVKCIYCGDCIKVCPVDAMIVGRKGWLVRVGGKHGRHPICAYEIAQFVSDEEALSLIEKTVAWYRANGQGRERIGATIARLGLEEAIRRGQACKQAGADAIFVESAENTDEERYSPGERYASTYEINMLRCIFCGYCEDACPTEAIVLEHNYELSYMNRLDAIYTRERLLEPVPPGGKPTPMVTEPGKFDRAIPEMEDPD
jgi:NADH-quinone oxidoreductase subunit I